MKERPILFSAPMVRAILDGRKTQTRRVVKHQPIRCTELPFILFPQSKNEAIEQTGFIWPNAKAQILELCPYGQPGDRLWVRETWQYYDWTEDGEPCIRFQADNATTWPIPSCDDWSDKLVDVWETLSREENFSIDSRARDRRWRPSIHMPRWASRILLEITAVRVERLQDISEGDARAEGCQAIQGCYWHTFEESAAGIPMHKHTAIDTYSALWESINGAGSWDANPWVWVVEFKRVEGGAA